MRVPVPILLFCLALFCSCASYGPEYRILPIAGHSAEDIFDEIVRYANSRGYRPDTAETDVTRRVFTSRWRGGGVPIAGRLDGLRHRMFAEVVRPDDEKGWEVRYYFEVQRIGEVGRGIDPKETDWEAAGQDSRREGQFHYVLSYTLMGSSGAGEERLPLEIR